MMAQLVPIIFINNIASTHHLHALSSLAFVLSQLSRTEGSVGMKQGMVVIDSQNVFVTIEIVCSPLHSFASRDVPRAHGRSK